VTGKGFIRRKLERDMETKENEPFTLSESRRAELDRRSKSFGSGRTWEEIKAEFPTP
jgi:hypothetical protein